MARLRILSITSEIFPLIKTGGLADVAGALPLALAGLDCEMVTLVPGYPAVMAALTGRRRVHDFDDLFGGPARLWRAKAGPLDLYVIDGAHLYQRKGNPYLGPDGLDWPDNAQRFAALGFVGAALGRGLDPKFLPDVVHAHDWQAGLAPVYLHYGTAPRPKTVITVHNLAFQGRFDAALLAELRLPPESFTMEGVEYFGGIGFLKGALAHSDAITTVSPTYAVEILESEAGMGLDGLLRQRAGVLHGILNGLDGDAWNPETDVHLATRYKRAVMVRARAQNKLALQQRLGLAADPHALLLGVVSRLSEQKGLDLLLDAIADFADSPVQLALLGSGDPLIQQGFARLAAGAPQRYACSFTYDEPLAHMIQGGSDAFLVPSRFEPCGLTQLAALRYGAIPVVAHVGGLADTVIDANAAALQAGVATGVAFSPVTREGLSAALRRTLALFREPKIWRKLQANGMVADFSWEQPARQYAALYRHLLAA